MNLVIDVGNTETVVGVSAGGTVREHWRLSTRARGTPDEHALVLRQLLASAGVAPGGLERAVVGSVVPPVTDALRVALGRILGIRTVVVDPLSPLPVRLEVEEPRTVGPDRIVNTLAASRLYGRDTVAVDLGTATTFDCITADGAFQGGVIAPGILVGQEWLVSRTAKLPRVELEPPGRVIGTRTESCLRSGIFYSSVDSIDGIVRRIVREWGPEDPLVVATGGFAPVVGPHCETVDRIEPFLTLYGLDFAGEHLAALEGEPEAPAPADAPAAEG